MPKRHIFLEKYLPEIIKNNPNNPWLIDILNSWNIKGENSEGLSEFPLIKTEIMQLPKLPEEMQQADSRYQFESSM